LARRSRRVSWGASRRGIIRDSALCVLCRYRHKGHWTGHARRLNRDQTGAFGSKRYACEELVAEITAAFVCTSLSIQPTVRHADYLGSWLDVLRADNRAIFRAASKASKAADFILAFHQPPASVTVPDEGAAS
jgi:antirestriction protein ArdC